MPASARNLRHRVEQYLSSPVRFCLLLQRPSPLSSRVNLSTIWFLPCNGLLKDNAAVSGRASFLSEFDADLTSEVQVPASVLAELHNIEASSSGRGLDECFSSSLILTGIGNDPAATFAGMQTCSRPQKPPSTCTVTL